MIMQEQGIVVEIRDDKAVVEIERSSACRGCRACYRSGEGKMRAEALNDIGAEVGDKVGLDIASKSLLIAYSIVFLVPLSFLVCGFFLGSFLANFIGGLDSQSFGFIMSFIFLGLSYLLIRKIDNKLASKKQFEPRIARVWKKN